MAASEQYRHQVALLVQVLPFVAEDTCFALKGGIGPPNKFITRDMHCLSYPHIECLLTPMGRQ